MTLFLKYQEGLLTLCVSDGHAQTIQKFTYNPLQLKHDLTLLNNQQTFDKIAYCFSCGRNSRIKPVMPAAPDNIKILKNSARDSSEETDILREVLPMSQKIFSSAKHFLLCDSALFLQLPDAAGLYALPLKLSNTGIRKSGKDGLIHYWMHKKTTALVQRPLQKIITVHLGNEINVCAFLKGKVCDISTGFKGSESIISQTGCGGIDISIVFSLLAEGMTMPAIGKMLSQESGWKAVAQGKHGLIDILDRNDAKAKLAKDITAYQIQQEMGSQAATLKGIDAIAFVCEPDETILAFVQSILSGLNFAGLKLRKNISLATNSLTRKDSAIEAYAFHENKWAMYSDLIE